MSSEDHITLYAYDSSGNPVTMQDIPLYDWYEEAHPLIDNQEERGRLEIARIEGVQYKNGKVFVHWTSQYAADGSLLSLTERYMDGSYKVCTPGPEGPLVCISYPSPIKVPSSDTTTGSLWDEA